MLQGLEYVYVATVVPAVYRELRALEALISMALTTAVGSGEGCIASSVLRTTLV